MTLSLRQPRTLDELLNFRLLRLFAVSGAPVIRPLEGRHGIARREWRLLAVLGARGALSPSALANDAQLDRPRTSPAIGVLLHKGLVARGVQHGDAHRAQAALTDAGLALYAEIFPQVASINSRRVAVLDDATAAVLDSALCQMTETALRHNTRLVQDVDADRRAGGTRRIRP